MSEQGTAGAADVPAGTPGRRRVGVLRSAAVVAAVAAVGIPTLAGSAAGTPARSPAEVALVGGVRPGEVALGGGTASCGGISVNPADLPGRAISAEDRSGPAEGISQILRLYEWTRHTPYDGARWSSVDAGPQAALLVATWPGRPSRYIPVRQRADTHWQIDAPCTLKSR